MSDDLISRKALLEDFRNTITENSDTFDWLNMISRQPVAYDPQKVINAIDDTVPGITNIQLMMIYDIVKSGGVVDD